MSSDARTGAFPVSVVLKNTATIVYHLALVPRKPTTGKVPSLDPITILIYISPLLAMTQW